MFVNHVNQFEDINAAATETFAEKITCAPARVMQVIFALFQCEVFD